MLKWVRSSAFEYLNMGRGYVCVCVWWEGGCGGVGVWGCGGVVKMEVIVIGQLV